MAATPLIRSKSAPQPIVVLAPTTSTSKGAFIHRSASHEDVDKDSYAKRQAAAQTTKLRQEVYAPSLGDPFNLSGFFPTSLSAIGDEEGEWRWLRSEGEGGRGGYQRYRGDEEGPMRGGGSAIFGEETSDTIKGEDKLGVLSLKDVSLFSASAGESGRLMSPYASDDVVDEHSLYLAQRERRERSVMMISAVDYGGGGGGGGDIGVGVGYYGGYGEVFLAE